MYGNLSKTIVSVPNGFHLSAYLISSPSAKKKIKESTVYDTFSFLKKNNNKTNNRYFRLCEYFNENSPYNDLNFNNNKRFISKVEALRPTNLNTFLRGTRADFNKKIRKSVSQAQFFSKTNSMNISKTSNKEISKDNYNESHSSQMFNKIMNNSIKENIQNRQQINSFDDKINLSKINEVLPVEENTKNNNIEEENKSKNVEEEYKNRQDEYIKKLIENKPHNLKELKTYLEMKYTSETKPLDYLPKIGKVSNSISQDDLFKKTLTMKLASLSMVRPEVKEAIFKRQKNLIMKRDFEMIRRIYNVRKKLPNHLRNIISYDALIQE